MDGSPLQILDMLAWRKVYFFASTAPKSTRVLDRQLQELNLLILVTGMKKIYR